MSKLFIKKRYGQAPNDLLNDPNISFRAKGLFTYLQSKPDSWIFSVDRIERQTKEGKDAIRSAIKELENIKILKREPIKKSDGTYAGYDYILYEKPSSDKPSSDKPSSDKPSSENPDAFSKKDFSNKEKEKKKKEKRSLVSNQKPFDTTENFEEKDIPNTKGQNAGDKNKDWFGTQEYEIAEWFKSTLPERMQKDVKKPILNKWSKTLNDCVRLDGFSLERVRKILEWARADDFWSKQIFSIEKLRKTSKSLGFKYLLVLDERMGKEGSGKSILDFEL